MKKRILIRGLVIGIIFIFIGIIFQPVIAVTPNTSEIEDDCDICPSIKKIKSLADKNKNEKLSNIVDEELGKYSNLKLDNTKGNRLICGILHIIFNFLELKYKIFEKIVWLIEIILVISPLKGLLINYYLAFNFGQAIAVALYASALNCDWL